MTGTVPRILRRDQLDGLRRAETVLREAEAQSQDTRSAAAAEARALLEQAQRRALKESARTASRWSRQSRSGNPPELASPTSNGEISITTRS